MRFTDAGIEDFMEEIEQDYLPPAETNNTAEPAPEQSLPPSSSSTLSEPALTNTLSPASSITAPTHSPLAQEASSSFITTPMDQSEADSTDNNKDVSCSSEPSRPEPSHTEDMDITPQETHSMDMDMTLQETQAMDVGMTQQESQAMDVGMTPQETQTMDMGITLQKTPTMDMTPHAPEMTSRPGVPRNNTRDVIAPPQGSNKDTEFQRQSPLQDVSAAMIEASQEIRQLREQQTQAALTDRVKRLSKSSDRSDRERFERGLLRGTLTEEPISEIDMDSPQPQPDPPSTSVPNQQDVVRQIAHRVSMQWKEAQQRGDSITDYYALIAEEIKKEQRAGSLPITPAGSRASTIMNRPEQDASARPAATPEPPKSSTVVEETVDRNVKVFKPPADEATPLSNQIDLPDDFYTLTAQDLAKVMDGQKARREEEENRGFKTAAMRAEEEKAKERRYPKTIIRIRFPDRVQIQGTFRSQETIGDLRKWVASVCVGQGEKFDLYITPPRKVLSEDGQTLYQAGLAPKSIVYFSWRDSKLNQNSPFLSGKYVMMMEDLPAPGTDPEASEPESSSPPTSPTDTTLSRTGSLPPTKEDKRTSQRTDRPGTTTTVLPKWMKLSKK
ncbi:Tether containing UBX domain for GLUT4 [Mortierella sp. NVP85]|nr:Tether containing UBX domain for GLUT4 [Mortierella sp. NVP85]